jgi:hypothetical protein
VLLASLCSVVTWWEAGLAAGRAIAAHSSRGVSNKSGSGDAARAWAARCVGADNARHHRRQRTRTPLHLARLKPP